MAEKYVAELEHLVNNHRLIERLGWANNHLHKKDQVMAFNTIENEGWKYMLGAEKRCRKIQAGCIPFSPVAVKWLRCIQVYQSLLECQAGRQKNGGNLVQAAGRVGMEWPMQMSLQEIWKQLLVCQQKCEGLKKTGWLV